MKGGYAFANLRDLMPEFLNEALMEGIQAFEQIIPGFSRADMVLSGIESRTSSQCVFAEMNIFTAPYPAFIPVERVPDTPEESPRHHGRIENR